jgi:hypothetical protein
MRRRVVSSLCSLVLLLAGPSFAEPTAADAAVARKLFDDARVLMKEGKFDEACPKLEEGVRLNPGLGMRYNLADCYEHVGKTASAWALFLDVAAAAKAQVPPQKEKAKDARARADKLEPQLSHLTIDVPTKSRVEGLEIRKNGEIVGQGQWGTAVVVDPATFEVKAIAPGKQPWIRSIAVGKNAANASVLIPVLEDVPKPTAPAPPIATTNDGTMRILAYVAGGVGVVGLGVGTYFGLHARSLRDDSNPHCNGNLCDEQGFSTRNDARSAGNVSTIGFVVGAAALAGSVVLYLAAPQSKKEARATSWIGFGAGAVSLGGAW